MNPRSAAHFAVPDAPAPDLAERRRILSLTVGYLGKTIPKLPNFYATRSTVRYENGTVLDQGALIGMPPTDDPHWRLAGKSNVMVLYRNGKEELNPGKAKKSGSAEKGLITRGTFGPILSMVVVDTGRSTGVRFSHWERGANANLAVFHYKVAAADSHYSVDSYGDSPKASVARHTGYHGEMAIDPATGAIMRLALQADLDVGLPILRGDVMVEYAPVEIGGKSYICPVRSVSISTSEAGEYAPGARSRAAYVNPVKTLMNDVVFSDYHLFRSESRIVSGFIPQ